MLSVVISKKYGQKVTCQNSTKHSFTIMIDLSSSSVRSLCYECLLTKDAQPVNLSAQTLPTSSLTFSLAHLGFYCPSLQSLLVSSVPCKKPYRQLHKIVGGLWEEQRCTPTILFCQEPRIWAGPKMVAWDSPWPSVSSLHRLWVLFHNLSLGYTATNISNKGRDLYL